MQMGHKIVTDWPSGGFYSTTAAVPQLSINMCIGRMWGFCCTLMSILGSLTAMTMGIMMKIMSLMTLTIHMDWWHVDLLATALMANSERNSIIFSKHHLCIAFVGDIHDDDNGE